MEFNNLKFFKTYYSFTKKEHKKHFNKSLLKSCLTYMSELEHDYTERVHVTLSWSELMKYFSHILLSTAFVMTLECLIMDMAPVIAIAMLSLSVITRIAHLFLDRKLNIMASSYELTTMILSSNDHEILGSIRQDLIDKEE